MIDDSRVTSQKLTTKKCHSQLAHCYFKKTQLTLCSHTDSIITDFQNIKTTLCHRDAKCYFKFF